MIFTWFQERRRREILSQPFPTEWLRFLNQNVAHYVYLSEAEQAKLRDILRVFLAEKYWEGCGGLTLTDEIKVTISAQACLLLLGIEHDYYANVGSIFVYPAAFVTTQRTLGPDGVVHEMRTPRIGEAWLSGQVVISWQDARADGRSLSDGRNVVIHEFAHKLDMLDGEADGVPRLRDDSEYTSWAEVMSAEYADLVARSEHGEATLLNAYGAVNAGEFFAVATEFFFEKPLEMHAQHPQLYALLSRFYHQDPSARIPQHSGHSLWNNE